MRRFYLFAIPASLLWLTTLVPSATAQEEKPVTAREVTDLVIEGSLRGMTRGVLVKGQIKTAFANWKRLFNKELADFLETPNFLLLGSVPNKTLKEIGAALEKQLAVARKPLAFDREDPWPGKLAVYLFPERGHYNSFLRVIEKRHMDEDELGCFDILKTESPHVAATAGTNAYDPSVEAQAGEQMAAAALVQKVGSDTVPEWVRAGFGRATHFRAATPTQWAAEHKRTNVILNNNKKLQVKDVLENNVSPELAGVLRASVIDYLAYSGRTAKFLPLILGYRPTENVEEPTTAMAMAAANLTPDQLNGFWQKWVRLTK